VKEKKSTLLDIINEHDTIYETETTESMGVLVTISAVVMKNKITRDNGLHVVEHYTMMRHDLGAILLVATGVCSEQILISKPISHDEKR